MKEPCISYNLLFRDQFWTSIFAFFLGTLR